MIRTFKKYKSRRGSTASETSPQLESTSSTLQHYTTTPEILQSIPDDDISIFSKASDETLLYNKGDYVKLQNSYEANFTSYLPYVLRHPTQSESPDNSSDSTIFDESIVPVRIMHKGTKEFNYKRSFAIASEIFKPGVLVFPSDKSLDLFKQIKKNQGSSYTNSDIQGINSIKHIIPPRYKAKGVGLPLFRVNSPHLSSLRKNCPFLIINKFKEKPLTNDVGEEETFVFCRAYSKYCKVGAKRYLLEFTPDPCDESKNFQVVMFDHNFNPYCDALYKNTRFRWVGTSVTTVLQGSRKIQLVVLDESKPSLVDNITSDLKPDPDSPLFKSTEYISSIYGSINFLSLQKYFSSSIPPFGVFKDENIHIVPKKVAKVGYVEVYEPDPNIIETDGEIDPEELASRPRISMNSSLSVSEDSMVLLCMSMVLREQEVKKNPGVSKRLTATGPFFVAPTPFGTTFY